MSNLTFERLNGWPIRQLLLPCGDRIVLTFCWDGTEPERTIHESNHNVFRLTPSGEVVWQVQRDDSNHPPDWWNALHRYARERGLDGAREPFIYIQVEYPDGKRLTIDQNSNGVETWLPGCVIWLVGSASQEYVLDPNSGIAKNVTDWPVRPW
jgi:hypothetical protein